MKLLSLFKLLLVCVRWTLNLAIRNRRLLTNCHAQLVQLLMDWSVCVEFVNCIVLTLLFPLLCFVILSFLCPCQCLSICCHCCQKKDLYHVYFTYLKYCSALMIW